MIGDQDSDAASFQVGNNLLQIQYRDRIDARKRLVEQNKGRVNTEAACDFDAPALASRQGISAILANMFESQLLDELLHLLPTLMPGDGLSFQDGKDVLLDRKLTKNRRLLREIADPELACPQVHGDVSDFVIVVEHPASIGGYQTYDGIEGSGFAGTIRAK